MTKEMISTNFTMGEENRKAMRLANLFFVLAIVFGLLLIFFEPPFVCPDENAHFTNICRISRGGLFADVENGKIGSYLTTEEHDYLLRYGGYYNGLNNPIRFHAETQKELLAREPSSELIFFETEHATLNPTPYLLAGGAIALWRLLIGELNAYQMLLVSKIVNLLFYAAVIHWAIRKTGAFRLTMFLLAIMPMSLFQGASTSYDAMLIPAAFLLFAYVTRILLAEKDVRITLGDLLAVCFACGLLFGVKVAYVPLIAVLLSIGVKRFGGWKKWMLSVLAVGVMGGIFFLLPGYFNGIATANAVIEPTNLQILQKEYFAENYYKFPIIVQFTVRSYWKVWLEQFFGVLGWLDTFFPLAVTQAFLCFIGVSALLDACHVKGITLKTRLLSLLGVAVFFLGTVYAMYVNWNPVLVGIVGGEIAYGGQGRYFIPVVLFILLAFSNGLLEKLPWKRGFEELRAWLTQIVGIAMPILAVLTIIDRYWT